MSAPDEARGTGAPPGARRRLHLVFLVRSFGFPEGMAATNRVRLLGQALIKQDVAVDVLVMRVSERPGEVRNQAAGGVADGIAYRYTTGSTTRADSFLRRRLTEARGYAAAVWDLEWRRRRGRLDCVYLAALPETWRPSIWLLLRWAERRGVPVIVELNELPSEARWLPENLSRRFSHLDGITGVVAISEWLKDWALTEAVRIGRRVAVTEVPIVVDLAEFDVVPHPADRPVFAYSASDNYLRPMRFLLRAMRHVWQLHPDCELVITGMRPETVAGLVKEAGLQRKTDRLRSVGYVDRARLRELFAEASGLLIPLADDLRSKARFPTKIGEYLASSRPVVTSAVGEIERFFTDRETAFIARPDDPGAFAASMHEVLIDRDRAERVGRAGRRLVEERFEYSRQGPVLRAFLDEVCAATDLAKAGEKRS